MCNVMYVCMYTLLHVEQSSKYTHTYQGTYTFFSNNFGNYLHFTCNVTSISIYRHQ